MTKSDKYWAFWLLSTLLVFGLFESYAFYHKTPERTLTYSSRKALGIHPKKPRRYILITLLGAAQAWLFAHLLTNRFGISIRNPKCGSSSS